MPGEYPVGFGVAELLADADRSGGWLLTVGGVAQSYVDLDDPAHLEFDYVRRMGDVVDALAGGPLDVVHLGGAGCTLPRFVGATRPGSRQLVFDLDGPLIDLVRAQLALDRVPGLEVRIADGRAGLATRGDASADLVIADVFKQISMPSGIATAEFVRDVARVLRTGGTYLLNVTDGPGLLFSRSVAATIADVFEHVVMLIDPGVLGGELHYGNIVFAASHAGLPVETIAHRVASAAVPAQCVTGEELKAFCGTVNPLTDENPMIPPEPPPSAW
ncbi:hypothetical protein SAMN05216553_101662 [Lentzea fradiae]|uniref:Spermidine synthase n=1 Tax=Lentzea fradiae TaxID=200378 RepID=A0A1G7L5G3_9PSEU|nr:hypothetical protein SAMN05216553_101662 [Lentzea fradiae]